ncbi:MAG: 1-acyl-sn-glycerol-3-phosphate acyltransferase [Cyclobacteriaceae bacterium]|nr:1-acyl-sn-glycerol-3-phosphate acyltransferase [Cyclobacteriaceae bacterium]
MKILKGIYTAHGMLMFGLLFLLFFWLLLIPILLPKKHKLVGTFNRWWAWGLFASMGIPWTVEYRGKLSSSQQYIFCPNHFSYSDIPVMGLNHHNCIFVGKSDMENIPLFGYMYRKLHITVDRDNLRSRVNTFKQSLQAIDEGKSLVIFPEGGIITVKDPVMGKFKDGAFRAAIEKQISIVPVTLPYNWIILPPEEFLLGWRPLKIIFHEPISTTGLSLTDLPALKEKVYTTINEELKKQLQ